MFAPCAASAAANDRNARTVTGLPGTTTAWVDGGCATGLQPASDVDDEALGNQSGGRERLIDAIEVFRVAHSVDQDAQRQTTADNDLLDVEGARPQPGPAHPSAPT